MIETNSLFSNFKVSKIYSKIDTYGFYFVSAEMYRENIYNLKEIVCEMMFFNFVIQ